MLAEAVTAKFEKPAEAEPLSVIIEREWRAAEQAFENLARHSVAQIAGAIPAENHSAAANLAVEFADLFKDLAIRLRPGTVEPAVEIETGLSWWLPRLLPPPLRATTPSMISRPFFSARRSARQPPLQLGRPRPRPPPNRR